MKVSSDGALEGDTDPVPNRPQAESAGHPAVARAEADKRRGGQGGSSGDPGHDLHGEPPRQRRGGRVMAIKIHHLRPAPGAKTAKTRVGRGEGSKGKTAGRGTKGSKARKQVPASFEGGQMPLHMRVPKLKGFTNRFRVEFQVVNLTRLDELFPDGGTVGVQELVAKGAVRSGR